MVILLPEKKSAHRKREADNGLDGSATPTWPFVASLVAIPDGSGE